MPKRGARHSDRMPAISTCAITEKRMNAADCSTGEQKALLISIVLADAWELSRAAKAARHASAGRGGGPSRLPTAAMRCSTKSSALGAQAWMTGTDLSLFDGLGGHADIFLVDAGHDLRGSGLDPMTER